jgi:hypothetical protein
MGTMGQAGSVRYVVDAVVLDERAVEIVER